MSDSSNTHVATGDVLTRPLDELDTFLETFAASHGLALDYVPCPGVHRRFRCEERQIHLNLDGDNDGKWYFWVGVSEEEEGRSYWKRRNLNGPVSLNELQADVAVLLSAAWDEVRRTAGKP